jgi:hypothetical protein
MPAPLEINNATAATHRLLFLIIIMSPVRENRDLEPGQTLRSAPPLLA